MKFVLRLSLLLWLSSTNVHAQPLKAQDVFLGLSKDSPWSLIKTVPLKFETYHPQGLIKIGEIYYLSSVQVLEKPSFFLFSNGKTDRGTGKGIGHLFVFNADGELLRHSNLGLTEFYHPGGMGYDGTFLWIPVAQYRPNSPTIIYTVNPKTLESTERFRVADHIGAIIHHFKTQTLLGFNWDSKVFYTWDMDGRILNIKKNRVQGLAYQDCHLAGGHVMLCGGIAKPLQHPSGLNIHGGLDLVDLNSFHVLHHISLNQSSPQSSHQVSRRKRNVLTRNAMDFEVRGQSLRFYFVPEDSNSTMYVFDTR